MQILEKIKNFLFPHKCLACADIIETESVLCLKCFEAVNPSIYLSKCEVCSDPFEYETDFEICTKCQAAPPHFDKALYLYEYNHIVKKIVSKIKFADKTHLAKIIAQLLHKNFAEEINSCDFITFVPMHRKRLNQRYFNQSALIAKWLGKFSSKKILYHALKRKKFTSPQMTLTKKQRLENIKGVFAVTEKDLIKDRQLLLVDDVYTTGATVNECAKILRKSGAQKITVLTFAKTLNN